MRSEVSAVVLAGGNSTRMGTNKALLPFGGFSTLAEYQYRRLVDCDLFESASISVKTAFLLFDAPLIFDQSEITAPIAALAAILKAAATDRVFVLAVDTPFFDEFEKLLAVWEADAALARTQSGIHPLCAVYRRSLLSRFEAGLESGDYSLKNALRSARIDYADFDERQLTNLNFRDQYEIALKTPNLILP
jgi:molybdopterin-guanine dinucleotide biosynthesis protein A